MIRTEHTMRPAIAGGIGTDHWNADAHKALSETYSISAALEGHAIAFAAVYLMWMLERRLRPLVESIGVPKKTSQPTPTKQQVQDSLATLRRLHVDLGDMCNKFSE